MHKWTAKNSTGVECPTVDGLCGVFDAYDPGPGNETLVEYSLPMWVLGEPDGVPGDAAISGKVSFLTENLTVCACDALKASVLR